ncbi:O-antigen ligase like membrane protein [Parafrankia irregularis]|uniref:O-antigen ligase like membrane protein n=1 Tax=Parafrankia irregularis TaxID=795642 RepID=A0A0S4QV36_9ACTN|nr:hypothetical protein [Parafrankia sp. CH37]CUU58732.1 O-antigen ligase like membrane protein [Parafrankia irregularis]
MPTRQKRGRKQVVTTTLTTRIPRSWVIPTAEVTAEDPRNARILKTLTILLCANIFLQRIAIPVAGAQLQLILPITIVGVIVMMSHGDIQVNVGRVRAYLLAMTACCAAALVSFLRELDDSAITSLILLFATYVPLCFGLAPSDARSIFPRVLDRFVTLTTILAGIAIFQFAIQLVGWQYTDVLKQVVPDNFRMHGFNTSYPVQYGSSLYKSNAFICLEPSFCSQFLAFGLVVCVLRSGSWWRYVLYVLALLSTVSGTGVVLLAVALVLLSVHKGARFATTAFVGVAIVVTILSFTPAASIFAERATETSSNNSSGSLRFVQPYTRTWDALDKDPVTVLFGSGPGFADRDAIEFFLRTSLPLNYALLPKLVLEYGVIGTVAFLAFVLSMFVRGSPSFVLSGSVIVFYSVLSGGLLSPVVTTLGMLLVSWFTTTPEDERWNRPRVTAQIDPAFAAPLAPAQHSV